MGKTGTTSDFRDALFVGSTYGPEGVTVAVRIGFDDNRSLGSRETGGKVALPVFKEIMLRVYRENLVGPVPEFPARMEESITAYLRGDSPGSTGLPRLSMSAIRVFDPWPGSPSRPNGESP
jgi:penicillin-binding protein 1A